MMGETPSEDRTGMKIRRDPEVEHLILDELRQSFHAEERVGIHVSDLLNPRYAYWQRVNAQPPTDTEALYFLAGRGHEQAFGRMHGYTLGETRVAHGIAFSPDFYTSIPIEFKTRRRWLAKEGHEGDVYATYLEQCQSYAALTDQRACWLWVFSLLEKDSEDGHTRPELACYLVEWEQEELDHWLQELTERKAALEVALETHDPTPLKLCWPFKCGVSRREMTTKPFCESCQREFQNEWGASKHLDSRTGQGHSLRAAAYTRAYEIKCPHYHSCQPYLTDKTRGESSDD